jgi:hypothetical protein
VGDRRGEGFCPFEVEVRKRARKGGRERSLYWVQIAGGFVQRSSNGPSCGSEMEVYWRQAHSSRMWKGDKVAGIHKQMSDIAFVGARWAISQHATMAQRGRRQKVIFEGRECVFWFVDKGWFEAGGWPGSLKGYSEDGIARRTSRGMEDARRELLECTGKEGGRRPRFEICAYVP